MVGKIKGNQVLISEGSGDETTRKVSGTTGKSIHTFRVKRKKNNVGHNGYVVERTSQYKRKDGGTTKGGPSESRQKQPKTRLCKTLLN